MAFMKYTGMTGIVFLALAGNMNLVQAAPYSVIGSFENPGFSDPLSVRYLFNNDQGSNAILPAVAEFGWGFDFDSGRSSRFQFDGANGDVGLPTDSSLLINLGSFSYTNLPTVLVGDTVTVDLDLTVDILGFGQTSFNYGLEVTNTNNTGSDPDSMRVVNTPGSFIFNVEGSDYELALPGFSTDAGSSFATVFDLAEGSTLNMGVYAQLNRVSAVPVPSAVWLFGSALIGLVGVSRRIQKS